MTNPPRPASRMDFHIAIICALPLETDAMSLLFDEFWDDDTDSYGRTRGDMNIYVTGRIGPHNVVMMTLPNMGTTGATGAAASMRSSYGSIQLALLVGVCGGVPNIEGRNAFLGDVVISKKIMQYDYGKKYPEGFQAKTAVTDSLGRASKYIRNMLTNMETERGRRQLKSKAQAHLQRLQNKAESENYSVDYSRPSYTEDRLFQSCYIHKHRYGCNLCADKQTRICEEASKKSCSELGCDKTFLVQRIQQYTGSEGYMPQIFIGCVGSGNTVIKSGTDRDRIAAVHNLIAFEMEGAGIWDEVPCIVVKGICDYADSHKNKNWQNFAAATAASVARAIIERCCIDDDNQAPAENRDSAKITAREDNGNRVMSGNVFGGKATIFQGNIQGNITS